jgi:hypothetical protein
MYATSRYVFLLGGGAVSWNSCKQTILIGSTMEAELTTLDTASIEAEWLREFLMDLPWLKNLSVYFYELWQSDCDSQSEQF